MWPILPQWTQERFVTVWNYGCNNSHLYSVSTLIPQKHAACILISIPVTGGRSRRLSIGGFLHRVNTLASQLEQQKGHIFICIMGLSSSNHHHSADSVSFSFYCFTLEQSKLEFNNILWKLRSYEKCLLVFFFAFISKMFTITKWKWQHDKNCISQEILALNLWKTGVKDEEMGSCADCVLRWRVNR